MLLACAPSTEPAGQELRVAVASNFHAAAKKLAAEYERQSGIKVLLSPGSTGKHYAQIVNGAPFDIFFAADVDRPRLLGEQDVGLASSRFTYALGRLALWTPTPKLDLSQGLASAAAVEAAHFAIANPQVAPYGRAAEQVLMKYQLWTPWQSKLVRGENIGQALQFVQSGNAPIGLVAAAQITELDGSRWLVPELDHDPIEQQAIQISLNPSAAKFLQFVRSSEGRKIIGSCGYQLPTP